MSTKKTQETPRTPQTEERLKVLRSLPDPRETNKEIVTRATEALEEMFSEPIAGTRYSLHKKGALEVGKTPDPDDWEAVYKATNSRNSTLGVVVRGRFEVVDNETGKVVAEKRVPLARIPVQVSSRAFVVGGKERYLMNQWRRKSGVFSFRDEAGEYVTEFNLNPSTSSRVKSFKVVMDREAGGEGGLDYKVRYGGSSSVSAWNMAKLLGATPEELRGSIGDEAASAVLATADSEKEYEKQIRQLHRSVFKDAKAADEMELSRLETELRSDLNSTLVDKDITKVTLGAKVDRIDKKALLLSMKRLQEIAQGGAEDDRESPAIKKFYSPADTIVEAIALDSTGGKYLRGIRNRLNMASDRSEVTPRIEQILKPAFTKAMETRISSSMVQRNDSATTPLDKFGQATSTTLMGEGAIGSDQAIPKGAKLLTPNSVGFLDPVHTPESSRAGVVLHIPARTKVVFDPTTKDGRSGGHSVPMADFYDKRGESVDVAPADTVDVVVGAFDQYTMEGGKIKPILDKAGMVKGWRNGEVVRVKPSEVKYWTKDSGNIFDVNTNLVPFMNSVQGGRLGYSDKQTTQTVPLLNPDIPLVQSKAPGSEKSMEELLSEEAGATFSPISGKVLSIREDTPGFSTISLKPKKGDTVEIKVPKNFPMNGGTFLTSKFRVEVGQEVNRGDLLADSNFTKDGVMATGKNLVVAYLPRKSSTFEDAATISESASKEFSSEHLYTEQVEAENIRLGKKHYMRTTALPLPTDQANTLDDDGVIKVGTRIEPNQMLMVGYQAEDLTGDERKARLRQIGLYKPLDSRGHRKFARFLERRWGSTYPGEVVDVEKLKDREGNVIGAKVHVKTNEPAEIGDKIYGRHANKAVISAIVPDDEMPRRADGTAVQVLYNPAAVPGRINPSQNFETWLAETAKINGKVEIVDNYRTGGSNWDFVHKKLQDAGITGSEDLLDPETGKTLKNIGVGTQYMLKAKHQVDHKSSARGIGGFQEGGLASKGDDGAQSLGELGVYGLLAQDAREFLRDAQLYKSEDRPEVWEALSRGQPLPAAKIPGAFQRFRSLLKAGGVDMEQDAARGKFRLKPLTDKDVIALARSAGQDSVIKEPTKTVRGGSLAPEKDGLFDLKVTGGRSGDKWTRFELAQRLPSPVYEGAIKNVLGLTNKQFDRIISGVDGVKMGKKELFGAEALEHMLRRVDLKQVKASAMETAKKGSKESDRSKAYRTLKTVAMLEREGLKPHEAFMRKQVLVLPFALRDFKVDDKTGDFVVGDVNYLYRDLAMVDAQVQEAKKRNLPPSVIGELESGLYDSMRALMQTEGSVPQSGGDYQGIIGTITGRRPEKGGEVSNVKASLLKKELLHRRQILSGRTVLSPRDDIDMDEVAIPRQMAVKIFEPLVEAEYKRINPDWDSVGKDRYKQFLNQMHRYAKENRKHERVDQVLDRVVRNRYVAVKRDPVLHKYGIQGFKPVLTDDKTVSLNPLVYSGLGADNDGDTLAVFAPITDAANRGIAEKMLPSKNLFSIASGKLEYNLSHESVLGLNRVTRTPKGSSKGNFANFKEARKAFLADEIEATDAINIGGRLTSYGLASVDDALPGDMTLETLERQGVIKPGYQEIGLDKAGVTAVMTHLAKTSPGTFSSSANRLRHLGQESATLTGTSLTMEDFRPVLKKERMEAEEKLAMRIAKIKALGLSGKKQDKEVRAAFDDVLGKLNKQAIQVLRDKMFDDRPNVNSEMTFSKARVKEVQLLQVMSAPGALLDGKGVVVPEPVMKSYSEGLGVTDHWASFHGARMGTVSKVIEVQDPGFLSKQVLNVTMDQTVTTPDCHTKKGIWVDINAKGEDVEGRYLAAPVQAGGKRWGAGSQVDANALSLMRNKSADAGRIYVRSPLTCEAEEGVCQKCVGALPNGQDLRVGSNFGALAGQALGERSTQLTLSTFHAGGVYEPGSGGTAKNLFNEASGLLRMPGTMGGDKAVVSQHSGVLEGVEKDRERGGWNLRLSGNKKIYVPGERDAPDDGEIDKFYKKGMNIAKGQVISNGLASPKDILEATGDMEQVQNYMVQRLGNLFAKEGVLKRNVEGVVRAITNTTEVADPGDSPLLPGERLSFQQAQKLRKQFKGFTARPILKGVDVAPREYREDFLARMNFNNLRGALVASAHVGAETDYHSTHPVPALSFGLEFNRRRGGLTKTPDGKY